MSNKSGKAALILAVLALLSSLAGFAPAAGFIITSSKQIKPGVILTTDIHKNAVTASDIKPSAVTSSDIKTDAVTSTDIGTGQVSTGDIGEGQVTPGDVTAPSPEQLVEPSGGTIEVGPTFTQVDTAPGTYTKEDPTSVLAIEWIGTAHAAFSGCVFQLRVNGQPASAQGGGEVFVAASSTWSGSTSGLWEGMPTGPVQVEVWARATIDSGSTYPCAAGPADTIPQSFVVSEEII